MSPSLGSLEAFPLDVATPVNAGGAGHGHAQEAEEEEESVLTLTREERLEPLAVKVVPPQPTEFICSNCYLVKHRSQLKDKAKMLCRDCA